MTRRLVLVNSAWLMADKLVRLGVGLVVWVWLARQVGPEGFGLWNYAIAFTALFGAVATLGMDGVVTRELVRDPARTGVLLGTATVLRMSASTTAALACVATMAWLRPGETLSLLLVAANALMLVLQSSQTIDLYFQARMMPRPAVVAVNAAFLVATLLRLALLALGAPLQWFALTLLVEGTLAAGLLVAAYRGAADRSQRWRFDINVATALLRESWPLLLSGLAVMIYMRMDQVMLASMAGDEAVGQFSAALRIAEVWYFIPMALMSAAFPVMMERREAGAAVYERYVQRLYDGMAWLGIAIALGTTLIAPWLIEALYGPQFAPAARVLSIQTWASVTVAMSFVHSRWLLAEGLQRYSLVYTALGVCVNLGLNMLLIPRFGPEGAAWATVVTQVGLLPVQLMFPKARRNFVLMLAALAAPYRLARR